MKRKTQIEYPLNPVFKRHYMECHQQYGWFGALVCRPRNQRRKTYTFRWGKTETRQAIVVNSRLNFLSASTGWTMKKPKAILN